ncbi:hypothetical protein DLAC_09250 [Tieghemostelium lacteum]|uniref:Carbohydrate binding domain-containing protein n=1 Tax=Tieghemostelium lacteum TaxID=361077 RepID=A0A151Z9I7_TIELA|nr:hypothetical protein DLAC_09250 [Tieghemostelium lacteum]|eukprot:KYQ90621.1 hypothetical protein DLAC_09250 [Tieghemostelium lacteum]
MNKLITLLVSVLLINFINAQTTYQGSVDFGSVVKGPLVTKSFANIQLPALPIYLEAVQIVLINKSSNQAFDHDSILVSSIDLSISGKKVVSFTTSNILTSLVFPSPNVLVLDSAVTLDASMITTNTEAQDLVIEYYIKYTTDSSSIVKLTRTATSVLANFSSFNVPQGSGGYSISNNLVWQTNSEAMGFLASVSPGIVSLSFTSGSTVICKSTPTYSGKFLESMSVCQGPFTLTKGTTYTTTAVYDNSIARKGVFGNFGLYIGFPRATTTSSSSGPSSSGPSSSHTTTGPSSTHSSSGPSSSGPSSSGPHSSGPSSSGPSSSGPSSSGPHSSSGPSSSSSTQTGTSGSQTDSQSTGSFTTQTTGGQTSGSNPTGDSTGSNPAGSTGYTISSGMATPWNPTRKIEIY